MLSCYRSERSQPRYRFWGAPSSSRFERDRFSAASQRRPVSIVELEDYRRFTTVPRSGIRSSQGGSIRRRLASSEGMVRLKRIGAVMVSRAMAPATIGPAKEVPLQMAQPRKRRCSGCSVQLKKIPTRSTPGAQAFTHGPKLLKGAGPAGLSAPTPTTPGRAAGNTGRLMASLPADATTTTPSA